MRPLLRLLRNLVVACVAAGAALARLVGRARPVDFVAYELDGLVTRGNPEKRPSWVWRLPARTRIHTVVELSRELAFLARIPTLTGIVVRFRTLHAGPAVRAELREALVKFRASGKRVVFHADALDTRDWWLASAGEVWLSPRGRLELTGFSASSLAAAAPLRRLGLVFEVIRAGAFKSAGELLGAEKVSDAQKQQLDELVGDLHGLFVAQSAASRGISEERVKALVDGGPYSARAAKEAGLADSLHYLDELRDALGVNLPGGARRARVGPFGAVFAHESAGADWRELVDRRPVVAVVDLEGTITTGKARRTPLGGAIIGSDTWLPVLTALRRSKRVKAVVLRIDSRGGSALASDLIWRAAKKIAEKKPVVAYLEDVAASGGYYIAAAAQRIVAAPTCITGSIGVFSLRPDASGVFEKLAIDRASVKRGAHADLYTPGESLSSEGRAAIQRDVLETYEDFLTVVAEGRAMPMERVRELAEGRVYLAPRARDLGLVDSLGTLADAVREAAARAGLENPRTVRAKPPREGLRELLAAWREGGPRQLLQALLRTEPHLAIWNGEHPAA